MRAITKANAFTSPQSQEKGMDTITEPINIKFILPGSRCRPWAKKDSGQ